MSATIDLVGGPFAVIESDPGEFSQTEETFALS